MTTAAVFDQYGPPEALRLVELPDPVAGPGEIRGRIGTIVDDRLANQYGIRAVRAPRSPARLAEMVALATAGKLIMPVRRYAFADVVEAHRAVESGHGRGKVVLIVNP